MMLPTSLAGIALILLQVFVASVAFLAAVIWLWGRSVRSTYDYEKFMRLPGPPPMPVVGNVHQFFGEKRCVGDLLRNLVKA